MDTQPTAIPIDLVESQTDDYKHLALALETLSQFQGLPVFIYNAETEAALIEPITVDGWYALASDLLANDSNASDMLSEVFDAAEFSSETTAITPLLIVSQDVLAINEEDTFALSETPPETISDELNVEVRRITATCLQASDPTDFLQESYYCVETLTPSFVLKDLFILGGAANDISSVDVDFSDGKGMQRMIRNEPVNISYQQAGNYTVTTFVHFSDGTVSESSCELNVNPTELLMGDNTDKVFVFAGGFSPGKSVVTGSSNNIKRPLLENGWTEVVIKNYDNKKARIQANAQHLIDSLIEYDNTTPISSICVMGFSMGGLVARMAVAMMNRQYPELYEKVCALVPIDAPMEGAYLGLSTQMFMRFANKKWKISIPQIKGLDSDPAKQMLFLWTEKMDDDNKLCFYYPHPLRTDLINELNGFYPTDKAIICLSCGSGVGKPQKAMKPGCTVFHWSKGAFSCLAYVELYAVPNKKGEKLAEFYRADKDWAAQYTYKTTWNNGRFSFDNASGSISTYNSSMASELKKHGGKIVTSVDTTVYIPSTSAMGYVGDIHDPMNKHQNQSPATSWFYIADNGNHDTRYISQKTGKEVADLIIEAEAKLEAEAILD